MSAAIKNKTETQKRKLLAMQKPTSEAIKEQVSEELDEQLPDHESGLVVESALKTSSKRKEELQQKRKTGLIKEPPHKMMFGIRRRNLSRRCQV